MNTVEHMISDDVKAQIEKLQDELLALPKADEPMTDGRAFAVETRRRTIELEIKTLLQGDLLGHLTKLQGLIQSVKSLGIKDGEVLVVEVGDLDAHFLPEQPDLDGITERFVEALEGRDVRILAVPPFVKLTKLTKEEADEKFPAA